MHAPSTVFQRTPHPINQNEVCRKKKETSNPVQPVQRSPQKIKARYKRKVRTSSNIQHENLELPTYSFAFGAPYRPASTLLSPKRIHAILAQPTDTLGTGIALLQYTQSPAPCTVDLNRLLKRRAGVRKPSGRDVKILTGGSGDAAVNG